MLLAGSPACRAQAVEPSAHSRPPTGRRATQCPRLAIAPQKSARGGRRVMIAACAASWKGAQTTPTTACGTYGSSREVISSAESFTFTDAGASSRWCSLVAPTIGAVMTGFDDVVERFERLLDRRAVVPAVDLIEIDVIGAEAPQAGVDLHHDCLARQAGAVWSGSHPPVDLGRDDDRVAAGEILHCAAEDLFAAAERI